MQPRVVQQFPDGSDRYVVIGTASNGEPGERIKVAYTYGNGHMSRAAEMTAEELAFAVQVVAEHGLQK